MRKLLVIGVAAAAVLAGVSAAEACGDKLLGLGRGVRFSRAYKAPHPASILLFERADGSKGSAKAEAALASLLQQAGHSVSVSRTPEEVEKAVQARPVDLIILSAPDADVVEPLLRTLLVKPTLIPILYKPKKADMAATEQRYHWAVAAPANPGPLLATIDSAVQSRLSRDTRARN